MIIGMLVMVPMIHRVFPVEPDEAERAPAMRNPPTRSFHSIDQSIAKFWAITMRARGIPSRRKAP
jgi:hypothetical protein